MKYLFIFSLFFSVTSLAQVQLPTNDAGQVQYQELVRVPDAKRPARQIMEQTRVWANHYYSATNEAEQQYDQEHNILFVRTFYQIDKKSVRYTLTVETKFGRYRATITDLMVEEAGLTQPVRAVSSTVEEMRQVPDSTAKNEKLIEQIATNQADLYGQIDKSCRDTLANLKQALTEDN
ncbi:hypothetical protein [Spirosoma flavum]|uniref:DUF4468 domain-containing protein n=1 Tax=Spirosoma flavum TaxID=2048557 RepID=A0ABW6AC02_9BACT